MNEDNDNIVDYVCTFYNSSKVDKAKEITCGYDDYGDIVAYYVKSGRPVTGSKTWSAVGDMMAQSKANNAWMYQ